MVNKPYEAHGFKLDSDFVAMFETNKAAPECLRSLIIKCKSRRDILEAPAWKQYIDAVVTEKSLNLISRLPIQKRRDNPLIPAGAIVHDVCWGNGQVVALIANFPKHNKTYVNLPYLMSLPDKVSYCADGQTLLYDRFGEGTISGYVVVFKIKFSF